MTKTREEMIAEFPDTLSPKTSHDKIQSLILEYANLHYMTGFHTQISYRSRSGQPDITLVGDGSIAFFEVKKSTKPTKMQSHVIKRLQATLAPLQHAAAGIIRYDDWPLVKRWIEGESVDMRDWSID